VLEVKGIKNWFGIPSNYKTGWGRPLHNEWRVLCILELTFGIIIIQQSKTITSVSLLSLQISWNQWGIHSLRYIFRFLAESHSDTRTLRKLLEWYSLDLQTALDFLYMSTVLLMFFLTVWFLKLVTLVSSVYINVLNMTVLYDIVRSDPLTRGPQT
jgi:hypothetical protein